MKGVGAGAFIRNHAGDVLLVHHSYGQRNWEVPGGGSLPLESPQQTVVREVREETGLEVAAERLLGVYYQFGADGVPEMVHFFFDCVIEGENFTPRADNNEVTECRFWPIDELPRPMSDFTLRRIEAGIDRREIIGVSLVHGRKWLE